MTGTDDKIIYALATPKARSALAIMRLSGTSLAETIKTLTKKAPPAPRFAALRQFYHPQSGALIDEGLLLYFPAPASYTGEDVAEFHIHGGRAVIDDMLSALATLPNLMPAEAGDFTRRAVLSGRLDLTRAEAVADLIEAETGAQKAQALRQLSGALDELYSGWRHRLAHALAHIEAVLEFADEDMPPAISETALKDIKTLKDEMVAHINDKRGEVLRDGIDVALIGAPNVGKSSLLNVLAKREAAIVSPEAGTTRDIIEVALSLGGAKVILADMAGLREANNAIEREGVKRARKKIAEARMRIFIFAADEALPQNVLANVELTPQSDFILINKSDLKTEQTKKLCDALKTKCPLLSPYFISAKTGEGVEAFLASLTEKISSDYNVSEHPLLTRARHRHAVAQAQVFLQRALENTESASGLELIAEDTRLAMRELGRITGAVDVEALLDIVFKDFCIGK